MTKSPQKAPYKAPRVAHANPLHQRVMETARRAPGGPHIDARKPQRGQVKQVLRQALNRDE